MPVHSPVLLQAKINSAWNNSAEGYVGNIMDKGKVETGFSDPMVTINMSVGHKLVTRIVADVSNKVGGWVGGCCGLSDMRLLL